MKFLLIYVPNLRFNGYTENWQKYRTIELGKMQRGKSKHRPRDDEKLYGGTYPFIQTGDIKKANLYIREYERTYSNYGLSQSKLWPKGTLCITIAANIAETAILGLNACFPDSVIGWISNEKITNNIFIKYYFDFYKTQLKRLSVGGAQENLNLEKLENVYFNIPTLSEQNDITNLLTKIDELIDTQSKIINDLKAQKNYIIHSIFSKLNSKLVLITDIAEIYQPQTISSANFDESAEFPVFGANGIIGYYEKYNHENEQICIACRGASVGTINLSKKKSWITGNSMVINSDNYDDIIDKKFLYYQLMFIDFNKYISGSGQPQITRESLKNLKIKVPSLEAQQLISNILNHIDLKITIELKLLCQYQLQKAFLLKNMFV